MSKLANEIDREMIVEDRKKLMAYQKDIKNASIKNYDDLHMEFVCENENLTHEEIVLVKKVFDFLKSRV